MVTTEQQAGARRLLETLEGPIRFALLKWALESEVFNLCQSPITVETLAQKMDLPPKSLALALRALVASGWMEHEEKQYRTAPAILPFVTAGGPHAMTETFRSMAQTRHAGLENLDALIAGTAQPAGPRLFDDAHWDASHRSLAAFHRAIAADVVEPALTALPEWPDARSFLEIGPGSAVLARRLLSLRPDLAVTLFELPPVAERIAQEASDLPISIVPGNYNDSLPENRFDIIWCSMTLYFHDSGLNALIARLVERLAPGGVLVSFHEALTGNRTGPSEHVIGRLLPALRHGDVSFCDGEIAGAMADAGLTRPTSQTLSTPFGHFRLDAARKEA
ncbi:class I SAM-dependent methyltransferase [Nitratireductor aquibiodomus]|uniref:Methyltransferase domain-containing protein n=1 Tax=Nitratireductor aquibiodomus TaxID=204799 RepID=A0A1H4JSP3_9HYPH|nr:class I SAM-dependent methyltransferase [Nitratireductor aquibiodomus]SEB49147.1 Methyltransferase domain-containing protein [Nitratireductor aquibiodomus]